MIYTLNRSQYLLHQFQCDNLSNLTNIYIKYIVFIQFGVGVAFHENGKRSLNKSPCYYCDKLTCITHDICKKSTEMRTRLAKILAMPRKEKLLNIDKLRYEATFRYNSKIISANEGEIIVRRRSTSAQSAEHYLPCRHCLAFYAIDDLTRHARKCPHQSVAEKSQDAEVDTERMISAGQMLLMGQQWKITIYWTQNSGNQFSLAWAEIMWLQWLSLTHWSWSSE